MAEREVELVRHEGLRTVCRRQWDGLGPTARLAIDRLHDQGDVVITETSITRGMPGSSAVINNRILLRWTRRSRSSGRVAGDRRRDPVLGVVSGVDVH